MEQVVKQSGCHILVQSEDGFVWTMTSEAGVRWYWHPREGQWTGHPFVSPTPDEATVGFDPEAPLADGVLPHHDARAEQISGGTP